MRHLTMRKGDVLDAHELIDLADDAGEALELRAEEMEDEADVMARYCAEVMDVLGEVLDC